MDLEEARHFVHRTGFGATPASIRRVQRWGWDEASRVTVERLGQDQGQPLPDKWLQATKVRKPPRDRSELQAWAGWWCQHMVQTSSPLTERLALFWHGQLGASVPWVTLMARHITNVRQHLTKDLRTMLVAATSEPAVLLTFAPKLKARKGPGERFAQTLLERWTVGPGHFSPEDVAAVTRAFTGWGVDMATGSFVYDQRAHDDSEKTFMGRTGRFNGTDIINLLLDNPQTAKHQVERLWQHFVSPTPNPQEVADIASAWVAADLKFADMIQALLSTPSLRQPQNMGTLIKSPIDMLVGTLRTFYLPVDDPVALATTAATLGQDLTAPPADGWPVGNAWIDAERFGKRRQWLRRALREQGRRSAAPTVSDADLAKWLGKPDLTRQRADRETTRLLLATAPAFFQPTGQEPHAFVQSLVLDPSYQLR